MDAEFYRDRRKLMEAIKDCITSLWQNPLNYSVKNWVTVVVIVAVLWHFGLLPV